MTERKNIFKTILDFLAYKEKSEKSFYIPEVNEGDSAQQQNVQETPSVKKKRTGKISKPTPVSQIGKSQKNNDRASENTVSSDLQLNVQYLQQSFNYPDNKDIIIRQFVIAEKYKAFIVYLDGMADRITINQSILKPLLDGDKYEHMEQEQSSLVDFVYNRVIETNQIKIVASHRDVIKEVLSGNTGIFVDGGNSYIVCETKGYEKRSVDKPQVEGVVKGPQEAFNENLRTNITLIRRILKNKALTTEFKDIGERNNCQCAVIYLKDLANPAVVAEVNRRIKGVVTDYISGDGILEQFIEDNPLAIIPTILSTERPDRAASHLLEGKVAIIADGTPFALIVPVTIGDLLHTSEDTTLRWQYGTMLRFIRFFAIFIATFLPGLYVALTTFHREMIPTDLLIAIARARENVPFPTIIEVMLMEISFELIREAGIRIPGIIGNTIGIIGALILGQAAVQASLVSPVLIIIIAFTGLGNFAIPDFSLAFCARIMRLIYIVLGATLGFYGISLGVLTSTAMFANLKSFGVPVFSIFAPKTRRSNDFVLRLPLWKQEMRPDYTNPLDVRRQPKISRKWTLHKPASSRTGSKVRKDDHE